MTTAQEVLQTMITPAVLISAAGTLILSTSNRTAKVTDRVRELAERAHRERVDADTLGFVQRQLALLAERLALLRWALVALYGAMGAFVAASLMIGVSQFFVWFEGWGAVWFGLVGASVLFGACFQLLRESRLATRSTLNEVEHLRRSLPPARD